MKRASVITTAALLMLFGVVAPAFAQHEQGGRPEGQQHQQAQPRQQASPAPQQRQQPTARPAPTQAPSQAQRPAPSQARSAPSQGRAQRPSYGGTYYGGVRPDGPKYGGVHHSGVPQNQGQVRSGFSQSRAGSWDNDHRSWRQRGGYNGFRVSDDRFRLYFGHDHFFRIFRLPMNFVGGYPRFLYDGYWVTFVDPWPEMWPTNWFETDDVYIDYVDDGYYLFNRSRPGPGIAVYFSM